MQKTAIITGLFRYQSIQNLTAKMNTDHILNHHMFTHQNSAIIHHFFHPFTKAVEVLIFGLSTTYSTACLHIGQNIDIHKINITVIAIISRNILNLCIAFTKYIRAFEISTHELYFMLTIQFIKYNIQ
jgi:hypothetical protein